MPSLPSRIGNRHALVRPQKLYAGGNNKFALFQSFRDDDPARFITINGDRS